MLSGLAFAYVPSVVTVPFTLLVVAFGFLGLLVTGFVSFAISVWVLVLTVIAVRENYALTTGRATGVVLIPIGAIFVLAIGLVMLIVFLFFVAGAA
jgi:hypothetical protein